MRMVHKYEEFCQLDAQGKVKPDVLTHLGSKSVDFLREQGWEISRRKTAKDLLALCRLSPENFALAYLQAGIDFWVQDD